MRDGDCLGVVLPAADTVTSAISATVRPREFSAELRLSAVTEPATDSASSAATVTAFFTSTETSRSRRRVTTSTTDTISTADSFCPSATATPAM